jgi:GntR family transcriptional regulator
VIDIRLPLYQRLRDDFLRRISAGEWTLDKALPSENELSESLGVAVGTVRKAFDALVAEGVLIRRQGKGTFLRRASFDASLFRFFRHADREGVRRVPESRILARSIGPASADLATLLQIDPDERLIRLDRLRMIDGEVVLVEEIYLPITRFGALADLPLTVVAADAADAGHLSVHLGAPLVAIERIALDCTGQPIEWRRSRGRGDRFRYRVDIR